MDKKIWNEVKQERLYESTSALQKLRNKYTPEILKNGGDARDELEASLPSITIPFPPTARPKTTKGYKLKYSAAQSILSTRTTKNLATISGRLNVKWKDIYVLPIIQLGNGFRASNKLQFGLAIFGTSADGKTVALEVQKGNRAGSGNTFVHVEGNKKTKITYF